MVPLLLTIASGQGYSLVPLCLKNLGIPGVEYHDLQPPAPPLAVSLVWLRENRSPLLKAFVNFVSSRSARD
jgi:DNA-binding transcriptional LysR family regulator